MIAVIGEKDSLKQWIDDQKDPGYVQWSTGHAKIDGTEYLLVQPHQRDWLRGHDFIDVIILDIIDADLYYDSIKPGLVYHNSTADIKKIDQAVAPFLKKTITLPTGKMMQVSTPSGKDYMMDLLNALKGSDFDDVIKDEVFCECGVSSAQSGEPHSSWCPLHTKEEKSC